MFQSQSFGFGRRVEQVRGYQPGRVSCGAADYALGVFTAALNRKLSHQYTRTNTVISVLSEPLVVVDAEGKCSDRISFPQLRFANNS